MYSGAVAETRQERQLENIVEAPIKSEIAISSETGEGIGHIVGAAVKAVTRLFRK